ncbi:MAG: hypothetical protein ACOH2E_04235 [Candidatus Paracaedibacter sp.]
MNYIFCFLFLMSISSTQCREVGCPQTALDCKSICACWKEKKEWSTTRQVQLWNGECHECQLPRPAISPLMIAPLPQINSKEVTEISEADEDN